MKTTFVVPARLHRAGAFDDVTATAEDDRRVWVTFSSETPVLRKFNDETFYEILGHGDGEVDLSRMADGRAPLLKDHVQTVDSQVGVVETVEMTGGKGRALVRFGVGAVAREVLARVRDGEISGISVGYTISDPVQVGTQNGHPMLRAKWAPFEITLCPVPADPAVGVGHRAAEVDTIQIQFERKDSDMSDQQTQTQTPEGTGETQTRAAAPVAPATPKGPSLQDERKRVSEIRKLARLHSMPDDKVDVAIDGDTSVADFQRSILEHISSDDQTVTRNKAAEIGMGAREIKNYSLMRAVRFLANPTDAKARKAAAFEIECSEAAQDTLKRDAQGLLVPADVLARQDFLGQSAGQRSMAVGDANKGAALVATDHLDGSFIGLLRRKAALSRLGVTTLSGLRGDISIPRQTGASTAYWVGEGGGPTESDFTLDNVIGTPHTLAAKVSITRRMMAQGSPDVEMLVRNDLVQVMALELDRVGINGDADTDAPDGLLDKSGILDVDWSQTDPSWADIVAMETAINTANADAEGMKYLIPAGVQGHLKSTPKVPGTAAFILEGGMINGYDSVMSNNAPAASGLFGNWRDFVMFLWSGLDLTVDRSTLADSGGVYLRAFQDVDFGCRHDESFAYGRDYL